MKVIRNLESSQIAQLTEIIGTPEGLRKALRKHDYVIAIRRAINEGAITPEYITKYVSDLFSGFKKGLLFPHEHVLSAFAVALETSPLEIAEDYLLDLSKLRIMEMPISPRVARICLLNRFERINPLTCKTLKVTTISENTESRVVSSEPYRIDGNNFHEIHEVKPTWQS